MTLSRKDFIRSAQAAGLYYACFSPDGTKMFVNVQQPGYTYAITGPWEKLRA